MSRHVHALALALDRAEGRAEAHAWNAEREACDPDAEHELEASERRDAEHYRAALALAEGAQS